MGFGGVAKHHEGIGGNRFLEHADIEARVTDGRPVGDSNQDAILSVHVAVMLTIEGRVFREGTIVLPNHDFVQARPGLAIQGLAGSTNVHSVFKYSDEDGRWLEPVSKVHMGFGRWEMGGEMHTGFRGRKMGGIKCRCGWLHGA